MNGIILAGGNGTRLDPITRYCHKHLLPINDKPMVYYPLKTLVDMGCSRILVIVSPEYRKNYAMTLETINKWDIPIEIKVQEVPSGIPEGFIIGKDFLADDGNLLILGDNYFEKIPKFKLKHSNKLHIFLKEMKNTAEYGSCNISKTEKIVSIKEKCKTMNQKFVITGLYLFQKSVVKDAENLKKSKRGEFEILDIIKKYNKKNLLSYTIVPKKNTWRDLGSFREIAKTSYQLARKG